MQVPMFSIFETSKCQKSMIFASVFSHISSRCSSDLGHAKAFLIQVAEVPLGFKIQALGVGKTLDLAFGNFTWYMENVPFIVDLPIKNGDLPIKDGDFPIKDGDFPINDGDYPLKMVIFHSNLLVYQQKSVGGSNQHSMLETKTISPHFLNENMYIYIYNIYYI